MGNNIVTVQPPATKNDLRRMRVAIKRTSLMIDELELMREEEEKLQLTENEQKRFSQLKTVFENKENPVETIQEAIEDEEELKEIRRDFLTASKVQKERQNEKNRLKNDSASLMLLATSAPIAVIGAFLVGTAVVAGAGLISASVIMSAPVIVKEFIQKKGAKKKLKQINDTVNCLSKEIHAKNINIDNICSGYGIPLNCISDREKQMKNVLNAADEYKAYEQKQKKYEIAVMENGTHELSRQISSNLYKLSGVKADSECDYHEIMELVEEQFNVISSQFRIEEKILEGRF